MAEEQKQEEREVCICAQCFSMDLLMLHCARCQTTTYCGRACQTRHWATHKLQCEAPVSGTKPPINTACTALYERIEETYHADSYTEFDKGIVPMVVTAEFLTLPYRFVARSTVCQDWQFGEVHIGARDGTIPSAKACRAGRWIFAIEEDRSNDKGDWLLTVFLGKLHGQIIRVDAGDYRPAFVLLGWMVDHLSPLLGREAKGVKPEFVDLDPVLLYEFKPAPTVPDARDPQTCEQ